MAQHLLLVLPEFFQLSIDGLKPFEIRKNDRDFKVGDSVTLMETKFSSFEKHVEQFPLSYTGRSVTKKITSLVSDYGLQDGFVVLGLGDV